jgi:hypothetical protein
MEVHTVSAHEFTYNDPRAYHATSIPVPSNTNALSVVFTIEISIKLQEHNSSCKASILKHGSGHAAICKLVRKECRLIRIHVFLLNCHILTVAACVVRPYSPSASTSCDLFGY